jgi:SOS response associated peptidase (SRAP)
MASCTIIVTDANALTRPIHDRMPVVLDKADVRRWLSGEAGIELLEPPMIACACGRCQGGSTRPARVMMIRRFSMRWWRDVSLSSGFIFGESFDGLTGISFRCSLRPVAGT